MKGCTFCSFNPSKDDFGSRFDIQNIDLDGLTIPCDFEDSTWDSATIQWCSFYGCALLDNHMLLIKIHDTIFEYVDFSGTDVEYSESGNNQMYNVLGEPYGL